MRFYNRIKHAIRYWLLRKLPACRQTVSVISESMERALTVRERLLLKLHLWVCAWCQWYQEHLLTIRETLREQTTELDEFNSLPALSSDARERLKKRVSSK
jgi:hypothetical protein